MKENTIEKTNDKSFVPEKAFFTLHEACELKGLNYKTSLNKPHLQPNKGVSDGNIGGRKSFRRDTILNWLYQTDEVIV